MTRIAAERTAAAMLDLPEEVQGSMGRKVASIIDLAMDLAEDIAPILAKAMQPDPAA